MPPVTSAKKPKRATSRRPKALAALHEAATTRDDESDTAVYCFDGIAKGMTKRDAVGLFRLLFPDTPASEVRSMSQDDLCRKLGGAVMDKLSEQACTQTLVSAGGVTRDQLVSIAALLASKPESEFDRRSKEDLCALVSGRLGIGRRFRFIRRLIPERVMNKIKVVVQKVIDASGDVAIFVSSFPYIERLLDGLPRPVLWMMQALSAKLVAVSGGMLGVREGSRGLRRVIFEKDADRDAKAYEDRITKEGMDIIRKEKGLENLERDAGEGWWIKNMGGRRGRADKKLYGNARKGVEAAVKELLYDPAVERFDIKNKAKAYRNYVTQGIDDRVINEDIGALRYAEAVKDLFKDVAWSSIEDWLPFRSKKT
eukprot:jgi/Mesvir1/10370/Mv10570-RA.1